MVNNPPEPLKFKISSALKSVIGRDLITNDFVAIFELVKNSADAGASRIDIIYDKDSNGGKLFIADNGKGMSKDDIDNKWLFVAYSAKKDGTEDHKDKVYAGNKGVGRFSCDRLGSGLAIQAKKKGASAIECLKVDWGKFEQDSRDWFTNISILYSRRDEFELPREIFDLDHGVIVEISGLRDPESWNRKKLLSLKRHLTKLIDPFGDANSSIQVYLHAAGERLQDNSIITGHEHEDADNSLLVNGPIFNPVLDILKSKTTRLNVTLEEGFYYSELVDRGELIYRIREKIELNSELNDISFSCQAFFLNRSAKQTFSTRMGITSVKFGSLFLFRNGFRVYPVGEEFDDFWGLARRKQQGHSRYLGSRDILGKVEVYGPESKFKEASSRDLGLITTQASEELKRIIISKVIRRLESYVVDISWKDILDKDYESSERMHLDENRSRIIDLVARLSGAKDIELLDYSKDLVSVLNEKSKHFESTIIKLTEFAENSNNDDLVELVKEAQGRFTQEQRRAEDATRLADEELQARRIAEKKASLEEEKRKSAEDNASHYKQEYEEERKRNLFHTISGSRDKEQLESFIHQLIIYAAASKDLLHDEIISLSRGDEPVGRTHVVELLSRLLQNNEKIITTSRFATSAAFMLDSAHIDDDLGLYVSEYIEKIVTAYNSKIHVTCDGIERPFVTRFAPIEIGMVLDNLIANAQKARASKVHISMSIDMKDILVITIEDNGRGISSSISDTERVFEKGYTTTDGSGLGLYHSKQQLESFGGEITLAEEQPRRGARFIIRIKK